ncbi:carbonic anhydrase [Bathymodiolus septemdierum thioautotrophic gill symbiont]|uniref:Carbonic anhydrase n=1 Tax=endosymbiont of Bathymodiolus septemdierum str. Myojin knoll TaxID=1303921 RepID=A0A0P0USX8_9GAMM|nr:carbonic anhydrase [Bathymodiolus septemdierum thioautotrophic gill symbiont]BAS68408.1 carbonic anhydrase [endosymbiont of Bathymodiolus septemdierum str. Myojin knoll]
MNTQQAQQKLIDGNQRFVNNQTTRPEFAPQQDSVKPQMPFAIVLGCSDSRVPIETIFDQSFGDLFIIRIAGNIVAPSQIGSIEFAISMYQTPLVIVLGHTHCGAVSAAIDAHIQKNNISSGVHSITKRIQPVIDTLITDDYNHDSLVCQVADANIKQSVRQLQESSEIIRMAMTKNKLDIVGAKYILQTGEVTFFPA